MQAQQITKRLGKNLKFVQNNLMSRNFINFFQVLILNEKIIERASVLKASVFNGGTLSSQKSMRIRMRLYKAKKFQ